MVMEVQKVFNKLERTFIVRPSRLSNRPIIPTTHSAMGDIYKLDILESGWTFPALLLAKERYEAKMIYPTNNHQVCELLSSQEDKFGTMMSHDQSYGHKNGFQPTHRKRKRNDHDSREIFQEKQRATTL